MYISQRVRGQAYKRKMLAGFKLKIIAVHIIVAN